MPVCSGSRTGWRSITPGASRSTGQTVAQRSGGPSSSGRPRASITRPSSSSPTGTLATCPVALHFVAGRDVLRRVEKQHADFARTQVEGQGGQPVAALQQFAVANRRSTAQVGHAVADADDPADLVMADLPVNGGQALAQLARPGRRSESVMVRLPSRRCRAVGNCWPASEASQT